MSEGGRPGAWWQRGAVYQVYPRSFMDGNGDGVGDLPGIQSRLGYLAGLGVDALWLSPIYPSPMADFGYDVADFTGVDPRFGTLADLDSLIAAAHAHGLRLILDYIPNHSSDAHPWFRAARASRASPKRDWYLWRDPAPGGGPPNNWLSEFGGPAWTLDPGTGQYYLHSYLPEQPDLNWRHPDLARAMLDVMRFWLDRGADGFRVDALRHLIKDERFRDNPPDPGWRPGDNPARRLVQLYDTDRPEIHDPIAAMRAVIDEYPDRVLIGELYLPIERLVRYYGEAGRGLHLPFNMHLIGCPWEAPSIAALIERYEAALPEHGWPNWVLGNHDRSRVASRVGPHQARVAAMLLLTLRGTPTLYYGDELGMRDVPIPPERVQDPWERRVPGHGRDPVRTPMRWDGGRNAGFSTAEPWLPVGPDAGAVNVEAQDADPRSMLALHRALLRLRRCHPALAIGACRRVAAEDRLLRYERRDGDERLQVLLNLGAGEASAACERGSVLLSTRLDREGEEVAGRLRLRPHEGAIVRLA